MSVAAGGVNMKNGRPTSGADGQMSRRGLFRHLLKETAALVDEVRGKPRIRPDAFADLPDDELKRMRPAIPPHVRILFREHEVAAHFQDRDDEVIHLFDRDRPNSIVFTGFNGMTTIGVIASGLAMQMSWDEEQAFAHAKTLFLHLVRLGVCVPAGF
jgi:hypothetical protein